MSKFHKQTESMKALEQSLNDHMEICALKNKVKRLKARVQRLTKAGDAMDAYLKRQDGTTNGMLDCRLQWLAAKEGKGQP